MLDTYGPAKTTGYAGSLAQLRRIWAFYELDLWGALSAQIARCRTGW